MADPREEADRRAALAALLSAAVMIAQQVGSKATRDALFLSSFQPEDLPQVVIASAAVSMAAVLATSRAYAAWGPARVVPVTLGVSAALYLAEWLLRPSFERPVAVVLYLHTAIFGALVISGFWSVVNERFDPHTAKRVVSRIGTGATFGGVLGGILAERVGEWADAQSMLVALAALNLIAAVGVTQIGGERPQREQAGGPGDTPSESAIAILRHAPYLQTLAGLVLMTAVSAALLDYAFKAQAARAFEQGSDDLLRFFAIFHVGAALVSFLLQSSIAKPTLQKLGVAGSVATLPMVVLFTAAVSAGFTRLATVVVARAAELVVANSLFRSGYELLYTPVAPERKRPTKALIDVVGNRVGDALGSGLVLVVLWLAPSVAIPLVLALGAAVAVVSLGIARRLHRGYVGQLETMLRDRAPADRELLEAATLQTLSTVGLDREALFEPSALHRSWTDRVTHPSIDAGEEAHLKPPDGIDAPADDPVHAAARILRMGDPASIRAFLVHKPLDPRLAQYLIALLARRDVYHEAVAALRAIAEQVIEPLVEALTDAEQPFAIRRRLPRVMEVVANARCAEGLARGLDDDRFEVRYRCALALARICVREPSLRPTLERVHDVVAMELEAGRKVWDKRRLLDEDTEDEHPFPLRARAERDRVNRSVEHVFVLLSLAYEPEPLQLSFIGLTSTDRTLRGTALEYLENVLPDEIRESLFPLLDVRAELDAREPAAPPVAIERARRPRQEIVRDLIRSMQALDRDALNKAIAESSPPPADPGSGDGGPSEGP